MPTKTFTVSKQYMADTGPNGGGVANPGDKHLPLGKWDPGTGLTWITRACLYAPISFTDMTSITEARLHIFAHTDPGWHAKGTGNHNVRKRRKTRDWNETSGTNVSSTINELWGGDGRDIVTDNFVDAGDNDTLLDTNHPDGDDIGIDITEIVKDWFNGSPNYGVLIYASDGESDPDNSLEFYSRHQSGMQPYIEVTYSTNTAPNAPTGLSPSGNEVVNTLSPRFSGTFSDPDDGDNMDGVQIKLYEDDGTTIIWNLTIGDGGQVFSQPYAGPALTGDTFYKWKARTKDNHGEWGPFSALQRFKVNSIPSAPLLVISGDSADLMTNDPDFVVTHQDPDATDTKMSAYRVVVYDNVGVKVWDSGDTSLATAKSTLTVDYTGPALDWGATYKVKARTMDGNGAWSPYTSNMPFTLHKTAVPTSLSPSLQTTSITPTFTGLRGDADDTLVSAQVQVYDSTGVTLIWDSGVFTAGVTDDSFSKLYGGTALAFSTSYKWRAQVTGAVGGTSDWSAIKSFTTKSASDVNVTAPVGTGITDLTPDITFNRTLAFNAYEIEVRRASDLVTMWDTGTVAIGSSVTSRAITYAGVALDWGTAYEFRVQVSSDGGATWGAGFTGWVSFETDKAGKALLVAPLGLLMQPWYVWPAETIADVFNGSNASASLNTTDYQTGHASLAIALSVMPASTTSYTYRSALLDLTNYGPETTIKAWVKAGTLTNLSWMRLRFTFATDSDYAEYDVTPASADTWVEKSAVKGTPTNSSGTVDWSNVTKVGLAIRTTAGGTITDTFFIDGVRVGDGVVSFVGATQNAETISTFKFKVYTDDKTTLIWDSGEIAGTGTSYSVAYGGTTALVDGQTYYVETRYTTAAGLVGSFSGKFAFTLNSAPSAPTDRRPVTGNVTENLLTPAFKATFEDAEISSFADVPLAFEIEVRRNSDDVLMHRLWTDSGLVAGENSMTRSSEGSSLLYEIEYKWRARYADSSYRYGNWSSYNVFKPSERPSASITSPTGNVISPSIDVVWTFSSPAGKTQRAYQIAITRDSDGETIYDTGKVTQSVTTANVPKGYLKNQTDYTISVWVWDTDDLKSLEATSTISALWDAPSPITSLSGTVFIDTSIVQLSWDQTNLTDTDFSFYQVYRRQVGDDSFEPLDQIKTKTTTQYKDYFAGNSIQYEYMVTVFKKVVGDVDIESPESDIAGVIMDADVWFVIGADRSEQHSFELQVTDETHTDPVQQEVFEPLGSSRKTIVRGHVLGTEGSLDVVWTNDELADAQDRLSYLTHTAGPHILKSPFGDVWQVEFAGPSKRYSTGGHLAATITFIEVE